MPEGSEYPTPSVTPAACATKSSAEENNVYLEGFAVLQAQSGQGIADDDTQLQSPTLLRLKLPARALLGQGRSAAKGPCQGQELAAPVGKVCPLYMLAKKRNEPVWGKFGDYGMHRDYAAGRLHLFASPASRPLKTQFQHVPVFDASSYRLRLASHLNKPQGQDLKNGLRPHGPDCLP
ncbi:MAG: hypothetical protein FRX49_02850 [Trebouxia sp. A1-2]|nr:MAG: hypothetical protein FRX49_02850 [Trebouxia sp. A1-2]